MKHTELTQRLQAIIREVSSRQKHPFRHENMVLCLSACYPNEEPREIATRLNQSPAADGKTFGGDDVIKMYKKMRLGNVPERKKILAFATEVCAVLLNALEGDSAAVQEYRKTCTEQTGKTAKRAIFQLLRHHLADQLDSDTQQAALRLNREFSAECLDEIADAVEEYLNSYSGNAVAIDPVAKLKNDLERTRAMLRSMQDSFDERLEHSRTEEQEIFFSNLNSQRYGYILDLLQSAQNGFQKLREKRMRVPVELHSVQSLIRHMIEFVNDYGVSPIMMVDTVLDVTVQEIGELQYEGSPFDSDADVKRVRVVSPGWQIEEHHIIISYPRVVETEKF
ncbi:MAG: hypothetical protein IJY28_08090 [Clostridia bacterium]|nr:hypothetical protein [Clostridia bacterium]